MIKCVTEINFRVRGESFSFLILPFVPWHPFMEDFSRVLLFLSLSIRKPRSLSRKAVPLPSRKAVFSWAHYSLLENASQMTLPMEMNACLQQAQAGNQDAQFALAQCFDFGFDGVEVDKQVAIYWYMQAAFRQHTSALQHLAYCFEHGVGGLRKNVQYAHALVFEQKANTPPQ